MKKRMMLMIFTILSVFVLAGCDLFGTNVTLPTETTTTTTTTASATTPLSFTISFEENGGSVMTDITQTSGSSVTAPAAPSKTGYTFAGWYAEAALTTAYSFTTMPSTNITLYAKWQINQYTISFEENGGGTIADVTQDFNSSITAPPAPSKTGYSFVGWYTEAALTNVYTFTVIPPNNLTLYAKWQINQYTIAFEEDGGSDVAVLTQDYNTSLSAPFAPTKTGYTFSGWYTEAALTNAYTFTTMPANNMTLYAKWLINQYIVTFYDDSGTILETQTITFGSDALAPADPHKSGFVFHGWDRTFTNVSENISVHAVFDGHYQQLVDLVVLMWGGDTAPTVDEIDDTIEQMMWIMGTETELETYTMMMTILGMLPSLQSYTTLAEFQAWFAGLPALGFDEEQIVDMLVAAVLMMVSEEVDRFDPQRYLDNIAYHEAEILTLNGLLVSIPAAANAYCAALPVDDRTKCGTYFDVRIHNNLLRLAYQNAFSDATWGKNDFDYSLYYDLEWKLTNYYDYKYYYLEDTTADQYMADYLLMVDDMTAAEKLIYLPILQLYMDYQLHTYTTLQSASHAMSGVYDDTLGDSVINVIEYDYFYPYQEALDNKSQHEWMIMEETEWMNQDMERHAMMIELETYLYSEIGSSKLKTLGITLYDILGSVVVGIDPDTFDLIFGLAIGSIDPKTISTTPEDISDYAGQIADLMALLASSLDEADMLNLMALISDLAEIYIDTLDMTVEEKAAIILILETSGPYYLDAASDIYYEMIDLLNGLTPEKVTLLMDLYDKYSGSFMSSDPYGIVIDVSKVIDAFLYDGTFDIQLILGYAIEGYYDVSTQFTDDPVVTAAIKAAMIEAINQIILLAHTVKDVDPLDPSVADMTDMYELYNRGRWLFEIIGSGHLEWILDPYDYLDVHDMFVDLIDPMDDMEPGQADALIDVIVATFGFETELETLLTIMQVMNLGDQVSDVDSIEDVQALYATIGTMGFDNATLAEMLTTFLDEYSSYMVMYEIDLVEIAYWEDQLLTTRGLYEGYRDAVLDIQAEMDYEIGLMSDPLKADTQELWDIFLYNFELERDANHYNYLYRSEYYWYDWDDAVYSNLINLLDRAYQNEAGMMPMPGMPVVTLQDYNDAFDALSEYEKQMYGVPLSYEAAKFSYHWEVWYVHSQAYAMAYGPMVNTSFGKPVHMWILDNINAYVNNYYDREYYYYQIFNIEDILRHYENKMVWTYIDTFFDDPLNTALVEDVALILLDEIGSLILYTDTDSMNLVIGLMTQAIDPSTLDLSAAGILAYANALEDFMTYMLSSIDEADKAKIILLTQKIAYVYIYSMDLPALEADALYDNVTAAIENYFGSIFEVKTIFTNFLATLTEAKIQTVMDNIDILDVLPDEYLPGEEAEQLNDNIVRSVSMASIIDALLAGGTLDTDFLFELALYGYFDFAYGFTYDGTVDIDAVDTAISQLLLDIILQAAVVKAYDIHIDEFLQVAMDDPITPEVEGLTEIEMDEIEEFHLLIEELMCFIDQGPETYVPIV